MSQLKSIIELKPPVPAKTAGSLLNGTVYTYGQRNTYYLRTDDGAIIIASTHFPETIGRSMRRANPANADHFTTVVEVCDATITISCP